MPKIIFSLIFSLSLLISLTGCSATPVQPTPPAATGTETNTDDTAPVAEEPVAVDETDTPSEPVIGGDRDEFGCLGAAGYSYDPAVGACTRDWESNDYQTKRAIKIAVDKVGAQLGLTVDQAGPQKCAGCYEIIFNTIDFKPFLVTIENWQVTSVNSASDDRIVPPTATSEIINQ